ncbi:MAG: hypothetical protein O3A25_04185 [Acidobacteria bacterium]|nr:hypothetical protein [Acidobacteriota bacterium]
MVLGGRLYAADDAPADLQIPPPPVDVAPLQSEELAGPQASSQSREHPRVPLGEAVGRDGHEVLGLLPGERVRFRLRFVSPPEMLAEAERGVRGEDLILHRRSQEYAQRAGDTAHGREREALGPTGGDKLAAVGAPNRRHQPRAQGG